MSHFDHRPGANRRQFLDRALKFSGCAVTLATVSGKVWAQDAAPTAAPSSTAASPTAAPPSTSPGKCDYSTLSSSDVQYRESLEYVELSPFGAKKNCTNCLYFERPDKSYCGGCTVIRGEVHPLGYCTEWDSA